MEKLNLLLLAIIMLVGITILSGPKNDVLEITARLCLLSEFANKCPCLKEAEETSKAMESLPARNS